MIFQLTCHNDLPVPAEVEYEVLMLQKMESLACSKASTELNDQLTAWYRQYHLSRPRIHCKRSIQMQTSNDKVR